MQAERIENSRELARALVDQAIENKARRPRLLQLGELSSYTDFIIILTATSDRHARSMADHMREEMKKAKVLALGVEGYEGGQWILLDYGEVVVHIFQENWREFYDLDGLWVDATNIPVPQPPKSGGR